MKLKSAFKKISFIFMMLMVTLTLFDVPFVEADDEVTENNYVAESISDWVKNNNLPDGDYNVTVTGNDGTEDETITYPVELINYYDDVTYSLSDAPSTGIIEIGDETTEYKMLVVKYHKNLTIDKGVTLTTSTGTTIINSKYYEITYKKGFYIDVEGTLTNNGTISMTGRGSNAEGENVYLWKNSDGTFEFVPAEGAEGAAAYRTTGDYGGTGLPGENGLNRQTGGGGNGGIVYTTYSSGTNSGAGGSAGTSYSGGAGGGGGDHGVNGNATGTTGGSCYGVNSGNTCQTGVGILTGTVSGYGTVQTNLGTGGLLIINANALDNNGTIESKGISPASISTGAAGGASGGGSINIFTSELLKQGLISTEGGTGIAAYTGTAYRKNTSGNGGTGSSTISYVDAQTNEITTEDTYSNNYLISLSSNFGEFSESFSSSKQDYTLNLDEYTEHFTLEAEASSDTADIEGLETYHISEGETMDVELIVTSENGDIRTYTITAIRKSVTKPDSKLETLEIDNYTEYLNPEFHPLTTEYEISLPEDIYDLDIKATAFDENATVTIKNNIYISEETGTITITVSTPGVTDTIYTINYTKEEKNKFAKNYSYIGDSQTFKATKSALYKIELWGAQGGNSSYSSYSNTGGKGAYTSGNIYLEKNDTLYVYVGGQGATYNTSTLVDNGKGYNGGGPANYASGSNAGGGGGATDVRLVDGTWSNSTSLASRIMVAAGGGGSKTHTSSPAYSGNGGAGGTLTGKNAVQGNVTCYAYGTGASQTKGGTAVTCNYDGHAYNATSIFGYGASSLLTAYYQTSSTYSGGGGGYYGGGRGYHAAAGGGSSYISGYAGSIAITSETSTAAKTGCESGTDDVTCSYHYSGKIFENAVMISGDDEMPSYDGESTMTGNEGNGYAKINIVQTNNYLKSISSNYGTLSPSFEPTVTEYTLTLDEYYEKIKLDAEAIDSESLVSGTGYYDVENNDVINISVTSQTGEIKIYKINIEKEEVTGHNSKLKSLTITDFSNDLDKKFQPLTTEYDIEIPLNVIDITGINATPYDTESTVTIKNNIYLKDSIGQIEIEVTNPNCESTIYTINYTRLNSSDSSYNFSYTGEEQTFIVPVSGQYKIELWGAQGGSITNYYGGRGAYTKGVISLEEGEKLYINVGGAGQTSTPAKINSIAGGYNGGGFAYISRTSCTQSNASGGGATDVRLVSSNLNSRIMVAAGGGGAYSEYCSTSDYAYINGGDAGALVAPTPTYTTKAGYSDLNPTGANQLAGGQGISAWNATAYTTSYSGSFGQGGNGYGSSSSFSGGGGGYYGGGSGAYQPGSGGSSYISGYLGSVSVVSETSTSPKTDCSTLEGAIECATHYSGKVFTDTEMISGSEEMPTTDGESTQIGNEGNGYAKISLTSLDNYLISLTTDKGTLSPTFESLVTEYTLTLEQFESNFTLEGEASNEYATITGLEKYEINPGETKTISITVTSESGNIKIYNVTATRKDIVDHNSKLKTLSVDGYEFDSEFESTTYEYNITIENGAIDFNINAEAYDSEATIEIDNTKYIKENEGIFKVVVSEPNSESTTYNIHFTRKVILEDLKETTFDYTGSYQEYTVPISGRYKIELWGAQGNNVSSLRSTGGKGAYTYGEIYLDEGETLYVYVGQHRTDTSASFNAGSTGGTGSDTTNGGSTNGYGGGGATDIRLTSGSWNNFDSLKTRIMVAAGGGGATNYAYPANGGAGGALTGLSGANGKYPSSGVINTPPTGGTQTTGGTTSVLTVSGGLGSAGSFGKGGSGNSSYGSGGGGGYYGGAGGGYSSYSVDSGAGGSSYISGYEGVNSISEKSTENNVIHTNSTVHYSGKKFTNAVMKSGDEEFISKDYSGTVVGNEGNGYAKITPLDTVSYDNYLLSLETDNGVINEEFDPLKTDYILTLSKYDINFTLSGTLSDESASVIGLDQYEVALGETKTIDIYVTSEYGEIKTYTVTATREDFEEEEHTSKLESLSFKNENAELTPNFHPEITEYNLEFPMNEIDIIVEAKAFDEEATITVDGNIYVYNDTGVITVTVSEPHVEDTVYTLNYSKYEEQEITEFKYTGGEQTFIVPGTHNYILEVWGAQGGYRSDSTKGGKGGYSEGEIYLKKGEILYIYVGASGNNGSYNGGGTRESNLPGGGGATDIRVEGNSLYNRIIVAGGGGSDGATNKSGGYGGGLTGESRTDSYGSGGTGGTQTSAGSYRGSFGQGGSGTNASGGYAGAGGGGWYGGGGSNPDGSADDDRGGGGGSGFAYDGTNVTPDEYAVENHILENTKLISGNEEMPTHDGTSTQIGNSGNGYAKITMLSTSRDNYLTDIQTDYGTISPSVDPLVTEYTLVVDKYEQHFTLSATASDENAIISGLGEYNIELGETKTIELVVTSESGELKTYTVKAYRPALSEGEHTSKLSKLNVVKYETDIEPEFQPNIYEYDLDIGINEVTLDIDTETLDSEATVKISDNLYMPNDNGTITITVSEPNVEDTVYKINYNKTTIGEGMEISYTGGYQVFTPKATGYYKLEAWGAQGGQFLRDGSLDSSKLGGKGAYTSGYVHLKKGQSIYVFVGGKGTNGIKSTIVKGGYNGGGRGDYDHSDDETAGAGGGATDFRLYVSDDGAWDNFDSLKSRIMVAAGGGGASDIIGGTAGGGLYSNKAYHAGNATQTSGNAFGIGKDGVYKYSNKDEAGGGGGYYGGLSLSSTADYGGNASGGSSFISGHDGCDAIEESSTSTNIVHTGQSIHYSNVSFTNTVMIDGDGYEWTNIKGTTVVGQPTYNGTSTQVGNEGNGYAKITPVFPSYDNFLSSLSVDVGDINPEFDPLTTDYYITVGSEVTSLNISARPSNDAAVIDGLGEHLIPSGTTDYEITVTSESGDEKIYTIHVTREASSVSTAKNITITGFIQNLCSTEGYCELDTEFDENKHTYYLTVPSGIRELEFTVDKNHYYQEVIGAGVVRLGAGDNTVTIEVTSEDGTERSLYTYEIYRDMTGNNYIDVLEIVNPEMNLEFNYLLTEYSFKVENDITSLDMTLVLDDPDATYVVNGNEDFEVGNNVIDIEVTAQNGEIRHYILNVYRVSNSNTLLSNLEVTDGETKYTLSPEFEDIKTNYTLNVENSVESVTISATASASTTIVAGTGTYTLKTGLNQFKIVTTAENGETETYTLIITRAKSSNNYLKDLSASEGNFNETFDKMDNTYTLTVNPYIKKLTISALVEDETASYTISGNSNFKIGENTITIKVTAEDGGVNYYYIVVTKEGSDNNYLSSLTINNGEITPEFEKETQEYNVTVENSISSININATKEDTLSTLKGTGTYKLVTGNNNIKVVVTSETGIAREYVINVYREYNADPYLKSLTLSTGEIEFEKETYDYSINVESTVEQIKVTGEANASTTSVSGNGTYSLSSGQNLITIVTTAENGDGRTYTITVTKDQSNNTNLSYLLVKEGKLSPSFDKMTLEYTVKIPYSVEMAHIEAEAENSSSEVTINNQKLEVGENEINIIVTAEDGSTKTYTLNIIRQEESESNLNIKTLDVTSCTLNPEFNGDIQYYECEVAYEVTEVTASALLEEESNTLTGTGNYKLNLGKNVIAISVTNENEEEKDYQVVVKRLKSTESRLNNIKIENHELNELFDKDTTTYTLNTQEKYLNITYEKLQEDEEVEIIGNNGLKYGNNQILIKVTSHDKLHITTYEINVEKALNENNYLSSLTVEDNKITPEFNKAIYEYNLEVENEITNIVVEAIPEYEDATVTGTGSYTLEKGMNEIEIQVKSEAGEYRTYKLNVNRVGSRDNYLTNLYVKNYSITPTFNKNTLSYSLTVEYEEESVEIVAEASSELATVVGEGEVSLQRGLNTFNILVTSENGEVRTYVVNITRKNPITSRLENIEVEGYSLDKTFSSKKYEYNVVVDNEVTSLDLLITKLDPNSTYVIEGNKNFVVGLNEVKIISTSSDKIETSTYTLYVNRQSYSNTYLSTLTVSEGELDPEFDKNTLNYEVVVPNEVDKITINATAESPLNEVQGIGEYVLEVGENIIPIKVINTNGVTRTYYVTVNRVGSNNANIYSLTTNVGTLTKTGSSSYTLVLPNNVKQLTKDNFKVILEDSNASYYMIPAIEVADNDEYIITVTSADGTTTKNYTISLEYLLSNDATIKTLSTSTGEFDKTFNKDVKNYTLNVYDTETEVEFTAEMNHEKATILNETLLYSLDDYTTNVEILTQAEDGTLGVYNIIVEKSYTLKRYLENIEVTGITDYCENCEIPEFNQTTYKYDLTVPYEVSSIDFDITKAHPNQKVKILRNGEEATQLNLNVGTNKFVIEVENTLGATAEYEYTITRLESTNNYIKTLSLISPEQTIEGFDKTIQEYSIQIPYDYDNISFDVELDDPQNASYVIRGATYLLEGNNDVTIKVWAASGDTREYIIHVLRTPESNNLLKTLTVSSGDIYTLTPVFTPGITDYTLTVPSVISKLNVEGLADDDNAIVTGNGEYDLKTGLNEINIMVTSVDNVTKTYTIRVNRSSSKNVYLKTLQIKNGTMEETFEKEKGIYTVNVGNTITKLDMLIEPEDSEATYTVSGNNNLIYGNNTVTIKVTSADKGAAKTYTLNVIKEGEENCYLKDISIDGVSLEEFEKTKYEYTYEVENNISSIGISATPESTYSRVSGDGVYSINPGENEITITVTAQNGATKEYTITVKRGYNNYLSSLVTDRGEVDPVFEKTVQSYKLTVENSVSDITVIGIKEDATAEVRGNGKYALKVGENRIPITVTNSGEEREYEIIVTREGSDNAYLKYLTVAEGELDKEFTKEQQEYEIHIPNDKTELTLDYEPEDTTSTVEVIGNENLEDVSKVVIKVTSTSGNTKEYVLNVIKEEESYFSNKLLDLTVDKGTMSPKFDSDTNEYTVTVTNSTEEIRVNAVRESVEATVTGIGTHKLEVGRNVIKVVVTSKDNKSRTYTLIVYRSETSDARLESLVFENAQLSPTFNKNVYSYNLLVSRDENSLIIKNIVPVEANATYVIDGDLTTITDKNKIKIKVTSPDKKTSKQYTLTVKTTLSSNAYLESLSTSIGELSPEFDKTVNYYTVKVANNVNNIIVNASSESRYATVTGTGNYNLESGGNIVNVLVTAENGTTNLYTINIEKEKSNNTYLKSLYVRGHEITPTFDKTLNSYTLTVENEVTSVVLEAEVEDEKSSLIGTGTYDLKVGSNTANIIVTSESGATGLYTVEIIRNKKLSSQIMNLVVEEGELTPEFNKETYEYTINIPNEYTSITPIVTLEEETASYEVEGNEDLKVGSNIVKINVTSSNGTKSTYTLNVIRQVASNNYLKDLTIDNGILVPIFNRDVINYTVTVPNEVSEVTVNAVPELNTTFVVGIGKYELNTGENIISVTSRSETGVVRTYKITVTREKSDNNYLSSLIVEGETYAPTFNKETTEYNLELKEGVDTVNIIATPEETTSTVEGTGTYTIGYGSSVQSVVVTAEDGTVRTYNINIYRNISSNKNIKNITPSTGTLSPEFDNSINSYVLNVDKDVNVVSFDVELESDTATVYGYKNIPLTGISTTATLIVKAEDGSTREVEIVIVKGQELSSIDLKNDTVTMVEGEEEELEITLTPEGLDSELKYEFDDSTVATIENGKLKALKEGSTILKVSSLTNENINDSMVINVVSGKIESSIYDVLTKEDYRIIIGSDSGVTLKEFIDSLDNNSAYIKIYDQQDNEITDYTEVVKTGLVVKLEIKEKVYDDAIIIVRGDVNEDGIIDVSDKIMLQNHILSKSILSDYRKYALDTSADDFIDVSDNVKLGNFILKKISSLN